MRLTALVCMLAFQAVAAKKVAPPAPTYSNVRDIPGKCESVWPIATRVLMDAGFAPKSADHVAGFMALEWTRGAHVGWILTGAGNNDVRQFTMQRPGFFRMYNAFKVSDATAFFSQRERACHAELRISFQGFREVAPILSRQQSWFVLDSSNYLESKLLEKIAEETPAESQTEIAAVKSAPPEVAKPAPPVEKPAPQVQRAEPPPPQRREDTQVVTLPGPPQR